MNNEMGEFLKVIYSQNRFLYSYRVFPYWQYKIERSDSIQKNHFSVNQYIKCVRSTKPKETSDIRQ